MIKCCFFLLSMSIGADGEGANGETNGEAIASWGFPNWAVTSGGDSNISY